VQLPVRSCLHEKRAARGPSRRVFVAFLLKFEGPLASEGVAQHAEALKLLKILYWFVVPLTSVTREVLLVWAKVTQVLPVWAKVTRSSIASVLSPQAETPLQLKTVRIGLVLWVGVKMSSVHLVVGSHVGEKTVGVKMRSGGVAQHAEALKLLKILYCNVLSQSSRLHVPLTSVTREVLRVWARKASVLRSEGVAQHAEALKLLKILYWFVVLLTSVTREVLRVWARKASVLRSEGVAQHAEALKLLKILYWFVVLLTSVTREVRRKVTRRSIASVLRSEDVAQHAEALKLLKILHWFVAFLTSVTFEVLTRSSMASVLSPQAETPLQLKTVRIGLVLWVGVKMSSVHLVVGSHVGEKTFQVDSGLSEVNPNLKSQKMKDHHLPES